MRGVCRSIAACPPEGWRTSDREVGASKSLASRRSARLNGRCIADLEWQLKLIRQLIGALA
jgi:hypothetical protein